MAQTILTQLMPKLGLSKKVLLLGSGYVTRPCVQLLSEAGVDMTVACRTLKDAESLAAQFANTRAVSLDASDHKALDEAISKVDLVISLIPYTLHANVCQSAIRNKKNVVTTSYRNPQMMELEAQAKEAGVTILNEIGLDPGIDHLYAVKTIDEVHKQGGQVHSFLSYCGGLPAPEASDNPLGYKFSWSARGVLLALRNDAKFWQDGKMASVPGPELMGSAKPYHIYPGYNFVAYANRDSTPYRETYKIPEAQTVVRGTLRYGGFPEFVRTLVAMGFLSTEPLSVLDPKNDKPPTWADATKAILGSSSNNEDELIQTISGKTKFGDASEKERILAGLRWLGVFSQEVRIEPRGTPLDTLCATLEPKMMYEDGERDFVMLQHRFGITWKDGKQETRTSTLVAYGEPQAPGSTSAMARLVGEPCAIATLMVLKGEIQEKGIIAPLDESLASRIRAQLEPRGIKMVEQTIG
ncbi:MAG: hypothetical protein Q9162_001760 [Coniocarpon cinnabarinum]